jgi:hypothetical protein
LDGPEIEKSAKLYGTGIYVKYLDPWQVEGFAEAFVKLFVERFEGGWV